MSAVHYDLAVMYMRLGRREDAREHFEHALRVENNPFLKELRTAIMLIELYPSNRARLLEAKNHLEQSLELQPQSFQARQVLKQLNQALGYGEK